MVGGSCRIEEGGKAAGARGPVGPGRARGGHRGRRQCEHEVVEYVSGYSYLYDDVEWNNTVGGETEEMLEDTLEGDCQRRHEPGF